MRPAPLLLLLALVACAMAAHAAGEPELSDERLVLQTKFGDIELAFFPTVAPVTVAHILELGRLGAYNTNHFFRVDKGFVAQVADVVGGRSAPLTALQAREAQHVSLHRFRADVAGSHALQRREGVKTVPGEFSDVKHKRGILSMGRYDDPNSATSSFSILLGDAPHLDQTYCVFGRMTLGDEVLTRMEQAETRREGIFVMPKERIEILSTYVYSASSDTSGVPVGAATGAGAASDAKELAKCRAQVKGLQLDMHSMRAAKLPS